MGTFGCGVWASNCVMIFSKSGTRLAMACSIPASFSRIRASRSCATRNVVLGSPCQYSMPWSCWRSWLSCVSASSRGWRCASCCASCRRALPGVWSLVAEGLLNAGLLCEVIGHVSTSLLGCWLARSKASPCLVQRPGASASGCSCCASHGASTTRWCRGHCADTGRASVSRPGARETPGAMRWRSPCLIRTVIHRIISR